MTRECYCGETPRVETGAVYRHRCEIVCRCGLRSGVHDSEEEALAAWVGVIDAARAEVDLPTVAEMIADLRAAGLRGDWDDALDSLTTIERISPEIGRELRDYLRRCERSRRVA